VENCDIVAEQFLCNFVAGSIFFSPEKQNRIAILIIPTATPTHIISWRSQRRSTD